MKRKDVEKEFIKIDGITLFKIINHSGLPLKVIRKGNKYHSSRTTCIFDPNRSKAHWAVVVYSYSKVEDPDWFTMRNLEMADHWLNPKFKYLLDRC